MDKNLQRVTYYLQKVTEFMDMPISKQKWRYPRLKKYKELMNLELKKSLTAGKQSQ